jgi:hypothetical protein
MFWGGRVSYGVEKEARKAIGDCTFALLSDERIESALRPRFVFPIRLAALSHSQAQAQGLSFHLHLIADHCLRRIASLLAVCW